MRHPFRAWMRVLIGAGILLTLGCGAPPPSGSPTAPGPLAAGVPVQFAIRSQRVTLTSNEIVLGWTGSSSSYRVSIGSSAGASDVKTADVMSTTYSFVASRTANTYFARVAGISGEQLTPPTPDLSISTLDVREIVDALFFDGGPMSEFHAIQLGSKPAAVWTEGTRLSAPVSAEAGDRIRTLVQAAIDDYAGIVHGSVTGTAVLVDDNMHALTSPDQLPPFTVATRLFPGGCPLTASGCATFGPQPAGPNAAIVTLTNAGVLNTVAHEFGHAYGLHHIRSVSDRPEFRFLMTTPASTDTFSDPERAAIAAAWAGGIRGGTTRDEALAAGLVLPYSGGG